MFSILVIIFITQSFYGQELKFSDSIKALDNNIKLIAPGSHFSHIAGYGTVFQLSVSDMNILPLV